MTFYISWLAALVVLCCILYKYLFYPIFLSTLSKVPNAHWSSSFSSGWLLWQKWFRQENRSVYQKHLHSGPIIRLAPNTLSINCFEDGVKKIYQGGFPKNEFYRNGFGIYGINNLFTFEDNAAHSSRKRLISNIFSKSSILSSPTARAGVRDVLFGKYLPRIHQAALEGAFVEILELNYAFSMDHFVYWQFGRSVASNFIQDDEERRKYLKGYHGLAEYTFWLYYFPGFARFMRKFGVFLIPQSIDDGFQATEKWNLDKCDRAYQMLANGKKLAIEDHPVVYEQAMKTMSDFKSTSGTYPHRMEIAGDQFLHNSAAFETSGTTETYLFYEMCRNSAWQSRLREELLRLSPQLILKLGQKMTVDDLPDPRDVDALPVLHAIIQETLRMYPSVPGPQPRVVPKPCSLAGYDDIPSGTIVQSYAYSIHRNSDVFPDPDKWKPERWLETKADHMAAMNRWFWAFSSGPRMCIGSHFAYYSMKYLVASVYTNFTTTLHGAGDMELIDDFLTGPKGRRVEVKFHLVNGGTTTL